MEHIASRTEKIVIRGIRYNIRHWGPADAPRLFFLHGWMDSSPTFQFVVDAFKQSWHVIAPDWRGYGESDYLNRPYWRPDYYADLDCILAHYSPDEPARLVGHSLGGDIACAYTAVRPGRVAQVAVLDFLGLKPTRHEDAPEKLRKWLDNIQAPPIMSIYQNHEALAKRLMGANPRLTEGRAVFLAQTVSRTRSDGRVEMACDPWHKIFSPTLYHLEDTMAYWQKIESPVLLLISDQGFVQQRFGCNPDDFNKRLACFRDARVEAIPEAGHNLQHDQPEYVAAAIEGFMTR